MRRRISIRARRTPKWAIVPPPLTGPDATPPVVRDEPPQRDNRGSQVELRFPVRTDRVHAVTAGWPR
ncbi:hypothetical protein GCM10009609_40620 [Pseudonocardia aurantiaca]